MARNLMHMLQCAVLPCLFFGDPARARLQYHPRIALWMAPRQTCRVHDESTLFLVSQDVEHGPTWWDALRGARALLPFPCFYPLRSPLCAREKTTPMGGGC
eukprot:scaffold125357_cov28-Tisochrysis_lutea.AAC.1